MIPALMHMALVYDGSLLDHVGMPIVPQPNSLLQYRGLIFVVKGSILNLDDECFDVHIDTLDRIDVPPALLTACVHLN